MPSSFLRHAFIRFLLVGVLNTLFGYALFAALHLAGLMPQVALAIAFSGGVLWNYFTHARLVFGTKGFGQLPLYVLAYILLYALNALGLQILMETGLAPVIAQGLLVLPIAVLAYIVISRVLTNRFPWSSEA